MSAPVRLTEGRAARGLIATAFLLLSVAAIAVGLLGIVAWSWAGFTSEVAIVLIGSVLLGGLGIIGMRRSCDDERPWSLLVAWAGVFALMCVALAVID